MESTSVDIDLDFFFGVLLLSKDDVGTGKFVAKFIRVGYNVFSRIFHSFHIWMKIIQNNVDNHVRRVKTG